MMTEDGDARGKALVQVLAFVLEKMVAANADRIDDSGPITKFHALRPPSIRIYDYLMRIFQYASCSPECFVLSFDPSVCHCEQPIAESRISYE